MGMERMVMMGAVVLWAIISTFSRAWGGVVGLVTAVGVGVWGFLAMQAGRQVSLLGMGRPLSLPLFLGLVALLVVVNGLTAVQGFRRARALKKQAAADG